MFVMAIISMCLMPLSNPPQCEVRQVKVEKSACALKPIKGQVPVNGEWKNILIKIRCQSS